MKEHPELDREITLEWYRSNVQVTRELGIFALKTIVTLNSGAFVVLLTFLGNAAAQTKFEVPLSNLRVALYCFLAGISVAFLVVAYTYVISQNATPYRTATKRTDGWFVPIATSLTGLAFLAFLAGVTIAVTGVKTT